MKKLILMRHAKQSGLAVRDHDRPLTDEGRDDARAQAGEGKECIYVVDRDDIQKRVGDLLEKMDLSKFIL